VYRGILAYCEGGFTRDEQKRGARSASKAKTFLYDAHPALITDSEYRIIEAQLADNRTYRRSTGGKEQRYPLSGLVVCARCGRKLTIKTTNAKPYGRYQSYQCRNQACNEQSGAIGCSYKIIEAAVIAKLTDRAVDLATMAAAPMEHNPPPEVIEIRRQIAELKGMYAKSPLSGIKGAIAELETRLNQLETRKESVAVDNELFIKTFSNPARFEELDSASKRILYHDLVDKVVVDKGRKIEITLLI
jgi:hypothetical protein